MKKKINHIGVFRALQLGDLLCAVPAFRALRAAHPAAHISLIGLPWAKGFVHRFSAYLDDFIHFPGAAGLPEQDFDPKRLLAFNRQMRQNHFDVLFQMHGNGTIVDEILAQWHPGQLVGFYTPDSHLADMDGIRYPDHGSEVHRHLKLMESVGIPSCGDDLEFPLTASDLKDFERIKFRSKKYVIVHPGSRGAWRQWPVTYFATCARRCKEQGFEIVITGTKQERHITDELVQQIGDHVTDLSGKTSLGAVAILIKNAALLVANCTGVSHIASALHTKSVIISMDGEPERWAPLNRHRHRVIDWTQTPDPQTVYAEVDAMFQQAPTVAVEQLQQCGVFNIRTVQTQVKK